MKPGGKATVLQSFASVGPKVLTGYCFPLAMRPISVLALLGEILRQNASNLRGVGWAFPH
jgi:hypothetical protein